MRVPIRVLHVIGKMDRGGAETMIMNLYRNIDKSKIQFDFVVHTEHKGAYDNEILAMGGKIYSVPQFKGVNILSYQKAWKQFFKEHKEYKVIHGHIGSSAAIYLNIAKRYGLYTIAHSHNTKSEPTLKGKMYSIFSYPTRYIANYFFGCSKAAGVERYGNKIAQSNKFKILNNAIQTEDFKYSNLIRKRKRKELGLENNFVIGHVGRYNVQKNHTFLLEIFKEVAKKNKHAILLLVGDGALRKSIEEKINNLGLSDRVILAGVRTDIPELLQAMDVFLFPSLYEGLPVTVIEAQASGLPSIISSSITEEVNITSGVVKFLSLEETTEHWAQEIADYYNKFERRDTYSEIVKMGYDINKTGKWLQEFYLKTIESW